MQRPTKVPTQLGRDLRPLKPRCDESPHEQDYYRANDCADEPSALASLIPPDRLPQVRCYKSSNNPEHGRPDEPGGFILISRINQFRDYPGHKPNYDGPKNTHCILPPVVRFVTSLARHYLRHRDRRLRVDCLVGINPA